MTNRFTIHEKATVETNGTHTAKQSKSVFCLETGEIFASTIDTGNVIGVHPSVISNVCTGKQRTCKGMHFFYVSKATENLNLVAMRMRNLAMENAKLKAKADLYDAWYAEQEAERKREEGRKQALILKQKLLEETMSRVKEIEAEINALKGEVAV